MGIDKIKNELANVAGDGYVTAQEALFLRQNVFADGIIDRDELRCLFDLADRAPFGDPEWTSFFEECAADFFLREEEPVGYLTTPEFNSIQTFMGASAEKASQLHLGLLVSLLEKAVSAPVELSERIADCLREVVSASGDTPFVDEVTADLVRRYLYAGAGAGSIAITREEAELLFDIHDITVKGDNTPEWADLFIKAIAAHLMQHVGYKPLPREEALRLHSWVKDQTVNPGGFFNRMFSGGLASIRDAYGRKHSFAQKNEDDEIARAIAERVTAREADWLADRIGRDGTMDDIERALIAYMKELEADLPPKLQALVEAAA